MSQLSVRSIGPSHRPNVLASAVVQLSDADGGSITISDVRILENKLGQLWVAMPSFSIPKGGRDYQYLPAVELDGKTMRELTALVLAAFEKQAARGGRLS